MTEEEAKAKWCPFARVAVTVEDNQRRDWIGVTGANRGALHPSMDTPGVADRLNPESAHCIGSACMAWRRIPSKSQFKDGRTGQLSDRDMTGYGTWIESGFCGLAGAAA